MVIDVFNDSSFSIFWIKFNFQIFGKIKSLDL